MSGWVFALDFAPRPLTVRLRLSEATPLLLFIFVIPNLSGRFKARCAMLRGLIAQLGERVAKEGTESGSNAGQNRRSPSQRNAGDGL